MTQENIYFCTSQIIKLIHYYISNSSSVLPRSYNRGMNEIHKTLTQCYEKIENIYYHYILRPSLVYQCS